MTGLGCARGQAPPRISSRDPFKGILSSREPGRARVSTRAGPTADQTAHRSNGYTAAGGRRGLSHWCRRAALWSEVAPAASRKAACPGMVRERERLRAVLLGCGATIVAAERRALGRNRVLGFISGSTAGARAVRRSGTQPRLRRRGKTVAVRCCAEGSVCAWTWPARGWRRGGAASRSFDS